MDDGTDKPSSRPAWTAGAVTAAIRRFDWPLAWACLKAYLVATAAALAFIALNLPLPWLLGPLAIALLLSTQGRPLAHHRSIMLPLRSLFGVAVGASFTPDLLSKAPATLLSLALMVPYTLLITAMGTMVLLRFARFDRPTAFFSAAPGGLADMLIFAQDAGADLRRVSLIQAARVVSILCVLPFWLQYVVGMPLGGAAPQSVHLWQIGLDDALVIGLLAWGGWRIAALLGLSGGSVVGPLVLSAVAHVTSLTTVKVPVEVLILTQISVGLAVGGQFKGISLREFVTILSWGFALGMALVLVAGVMAKAVSGITGLDATSLLLSYAPGGQNEMAIIALILGIDVAIIAMHHLLRVVIVIVGAQIVFRSLKRMETDDSARPP